jgi:hypothetical protein
MVVGFITTYAMSAYVVSSNPTHYVISLTEGKIVPVPYKSNVNDKELQYNCFKICRYLSLVKIRR